MEVAKDVPWWDAGQGSNDFLIFADGFDRLTVNGTCPPPPQYSDARQSAPDHFRHTLHPFTGRGRNGFVLCREEREEEGRRNQDGALVLRGSGWLRVCWHVLGLFFDTNPDQPLISVTGSQAIVWVRL